MDQSARTKVLIKIEQIARLRVGGISDDKICAMLNITRSGLSRILTLADYKETEDAVLMGTVTKMDEALAGRAALIRQTFAVGVPAAMRALLETVTQKRDLRARLEAAREFLDRDPDRTFTKDRTQVTPEVSLPDKVLESAEVDGEKVAAAIKQPVVQ